MSSFAEDEAVPAALFSPPPPISSFFLMLKVDPGLTRKYTFVFIILFPFLFF
jgi:hypothetical protein